MSLTDIMSAMQLAHYAQWALGLFLLGFVAVLAKVVSMSRGAAETHARLPLGSEEPANTRRGEEPWT